MHGDVEGVASRPRPLSGGLWTLFSWLRRDDHASSNESLSSVGSDRTAASFAFLAPAHYSVNNNPVLLPPPSPPTDSYRKRVQERNARRQHDRDLTLHRKYGLYRSENSNGYDAFSLPPVRRTEGDISSKWERERRATSECFQRRALHVPGKRRAPLPPVRAIVGSSVTHYRGPRKRRAPQPPIKIIEENKETVLETNNNSILMNPQIVSNDKNISTTNTSEKCNKKGNSSKDTKTRSEKGFLKHIFENRKRNSTIDTSAVKILPSISELDKQAATIIENSKREALKQSKKTDQQHQQSLLDNFNKKSKADSWFCIKCLRKYDSSVSDCPYCIFDQKQTTIELLKSNAPNAATNASSTCTQTESQSLISQTPSRYNSEEKQKLKEMLKEMKDSLPKRPKHENKERILNKICTAGTVSTVVEKNAVSETPTLKIGSSVANDDNDSIPTKPSTSGICEKMIISNNTTPLESFSSVITSRPIVMHHEAKQNNYFIPNTSNLKLKDSIPQLLTVNNISKTSQANENNIIKKSLENKQKMDDKLVGVSCPNKNLQTPLRISSLLNPVYVPKSTESKSFPTENVLHIELRPSQTRGDKVLDNTKEVPHNIVSSSSGITSTPITTGIHCDSTNVNTATKNNENIKISNITVVNKSPPVSSNQSITNVKNTSNSTINLGHENNNDVRPSTSTDMPTNNSKTKTVELDGINQHIKRRELINQLEKSIANGDEHAAAEAAVKLAQLRLSCSVLSFSSQIMSEQSTPKLVEKNNYSGSVTNEPTKKTQNKPKSNIVDAIESRLPSNSTPVVAPIASSKEKYLQRNEIKINLPQNDKSVSSSDKIASEKVDLVASNSREVFKNPSSIEASTCKEKANAEVSISVWVEDKEATRGPIKLNTNRQAIVGDLRKQAEAALGLPSHLQRWIVGRNLCTDDNTPLITLAGSEFNAPFYLCLVETDPHVASTSRKVEEKAADNANKNTSNNVYKELVQLEQQALVNNAEVFECGVCIEDCNPGSGVILRECVHMFCKECLADVVRHSEEPDISCPAMGCSGVLQEREIRGLVSPEDYERWLARGLAAAESGTRNAFHCRTPDCTGWALCDPGVRRFLCPVCKHNNCVPCQAIHEGETCEQHRAKLQAVSNIKSSNQSDDSTRALLNNLINKGEALECPECKAIITKMWGCDWVKCSACKTEICWVTRDRRWGPAGRGDTSAGCRCGVDGKRCHPSCGYCH